MADFVQVDAAGIAAVHTNSPKVEVATVGIAVVWGENPLARVKVDGAGLAVVWDEESGPGPGPGGRKFPVLNDLTIWQSQAGKRKFPVVIDFD